MPTTKPVKIQMTAYDPEPEDTETKLRFEHFAIGHKNYIKALKRLLDQAKVA